MAPTLSALVDHVAGGIAELRHYMTAGGPLTPTERISAAREIYMAAAAVANLRHVLSQAEARQGDELGRAVERGSHAGA
jgi:hypothetical protein